MGREQDFTMFDGRYLNLINIGIKKSIENCNHQIRKVKEWLKNQT
jgi:hypothetical protein